MLRLLAVAMLPLALAVTFIGWKQWSDARAESQQRLRNITMQARDAIERDLTQMRSILETLASSDTIIDSNWLGLYVRSRRLVAGHEGHLIALTDRSGQLVFNTAMPWGTTLPNLWEIESAERTAEWQGKQMPVSSQGMTRRVFELGVPQISGLYFGVSVQRPAFSMAVPVTRDGQTDYTLTLSVPPDDLADRLDTFGIDEAIGLALVDRDGRVIAANLHAVMQAGDVLDAASMDPSVNRGGGEDVVARFNGRRYVQHALALPSSGWTLRAFWPESVANAPAREAALGAAAMLISLLGFTLVAVGQFARRITDALKDLVPKGGDEALHSLGQDRGGILEIEEVRQQLLAGRQAREREVTAQRAQAAAEHREALARTAERWIRNIMDNLSVFVMVTDSQGCINEVNRSTQTSAGLVRSDLVGLPLWQCPCWQYDASSEERLRAAFAEVRQGRTVRFDLTAQWTSGGLRTIDLQLSPLMEAEQPSLVIVSGVDVSDREQVRRDLLDANLRISEMAERKDEFLAMISHELRNPLGPLKASAYVLDRVGADTPRAVRARSVIQRQVAHLGRLVDDLLDVTRLARGKFELRREWIDLRALVRGTVEDLSTILDQRLDGQPMLHLALPEHPVWVLADKVRTDQVVRNLLDNAVKFTPVDGTIDVRLESDGSTARFSVSDSGIGIDAELLSRLFEPFAQGDRSLARSGGGLGLGLAVAKGIADMHGWRIEVGSAGAGAGAKFSIEVPSCRRAWPAEQAVADGAAPCDGVDSKAVLVVDDNVDGAESVAELVRLFGHRADVAHDGQEALQTLQQRTVDCVLCDIGLPDMDGYELGRRIRERFRAMQLISLTGYGQPEDVQRALAAGFDHHVVKPIDAAVLVRLLGDASMNPRSISLADDSSASGRGGPSTLSTGA